MVWNFFLKCEIISIFSCKLAQQHLNNDSHVSSFPLLFAEGKNCLAVFWIYSKNYVCMAEVVGLFSFSCSSSSWYFFKLQFFYKKRFQCLSCRWTSPCCHNFLFLITFSVIFLKGQVLCVCIQCMLLNRRPCVSWL